MVSEISELVSKDSKLSAHIHDKSKEEEKSRQPFNVNSATEDESGLSSSNYSVLSRDSGKFNDDEPQKEKPYVGPISLRPQGKEQKKTPTKPIVVSKATADDK